MLRAPKRDQVLELAVLLAHKVAARDLRGNGNMFGREHQRGGDCHRARRPAGAQSHGLRSAQSAGRGRRRRPRSAGAHSSGMGTCHEEVEDQGGKRRCRIEVIECELTALRMAGEMSVKGGDGPRRAKAAT
eukprot:364454-Chlamydomonas_euryale.AAC.5